MYGLDVRQVRDYVVRPVLEDLGVWSLPAEALVLGTAAQESQFVNLHQVGGGPALGLWQMEPATFDDLFVSYLAFRPGLDRTVRALISAANAAGRPPLALELAWNLRLGAAMCRLHYLRAPFELPVVGDVAGMARAWKEFYNTPGGAGTADEFVNNYRRFVAPVMGGSA